MIVLPVRKEKVVIGVVVEWNIVNDDCIVCTCYKEPYADTVVEALNRCQQLEDDIKYMKTRTAYWSYCTWEGMRKHAPELKQELIGWFTAMDVSPYKYKVLRPQSESE